MLKLLRVNKTGKTLELSERKFRFKILPSVSGVG